MTSFERGIFTLSLDLELIWGTQDLFGPEAFRAACARERALVGRLLETLESFGMPAWRCDSAADFGARLQHALTLDVPSLIVLPIDYSLDVAISEELGAETVAT